MLPHVQQGKHASTVVKSTLAITSKSRNAMLVGGPCSQRAAAAFAVFRLILCSGPTFVFCPKAKHDFAPASPFSLSTREPFTSSCDRKFFCEQSSSVDGLWYWPRLASSADHLGHRAASARTSSVRDVGNVAAGDSICSHSRSSYSSHRFPVSSEFVCVGWPRAAHPMKQAPLLLGFSTFFSTASTHLPSCFRR